jgi:hypothetical protein
VDWRLAKQGQPGARTRDTNNKKMFQFMRKSEKDREKKPGKSSSSGGGVGGGGGGTATGSVDAAKATSFGKKVKDKLSPDDLHRLDEIRRSFKLGKAKKEKQKLPSGIIADYSENFIMQPPSHQSSTSSSSLKSPVYGGSEGYSSQGTYATTGVTHSDSSESSLSANSASFSAPPPLPPHYQQNPHHHQSLEIPGTKE